MLRGIILLAAMLSGGTPGDAVTDTWSAVQDGSPREFLASLTDETCEAVIGVCEEYLQVLNGMTSEELGRVFASLRLEAAPNEVRHWDPMAVLEMVMSSPENHSIISRTSLRIDSVIPRDDAAIVHLTLGLPDGDSVSFPLYAAESPLGWRTGGVEPLVDRALESALGN